MPAEESNTKATTPSERAGGGGDLLPVVEEEPPTIFDDRLRDAVDKARLARSQESTSQRQQQPTLTGPSNSKIYNNKNRHGQDTAPRIRSLPDTRASHARASTCLLSIPELRAIESSEFQPKIVIPPSCNRRHNSCAPGTSADHRRGSTDSTTSWRAHLDRFQDAAKTRRDSATSIINRLLTDSLSEITMSPLPKSFSERQSSQRAFRQMQKRRHTSYDVHTFVGLQGVQEKQQINLDRLVSREVVIKDKDVDGGYAWIILAVVFIINASTFGTARAYGLIFDKLARGGNLGGSEDQSRTTAAMPFTIMGAVENMAGPLSGCLLAMTKSWRTTVCLGSCLIALAHMLAALADNCQLGQLLSMGLMCGVGLSLVSISFFQVNNAYFVRYKNTAFGIGLTGAAFGTLFISPLCQFFLDNYEGTGMCYLMLGLIIAPNALLALLLKPKKQQSTTITANQSYDDHNQATVITTSPVTDLEPEQLKTISARVEEGEEAAEDEDEEEQDLRKIGIWTSIKQVVMNPMFHLIWPTQLLFCWLNFVFGMIIVDFAKDRGLAARDVSHLVPCWAFGQLVGRLVLSALVDLKFLSCKSFTALCFLAIGITTQLLNTTRLPDDTSTDSQQTATVVNSITGLSLLKISPPTINHLHLIILALVFILSMFIALLYILLNGLIVTYVDTPLQPLTIGISSFAGSFFLLPRANVIGYYRDTTGNYDAMLTMFTCVSLSAALIWLMVPTACNYLKRCFQEKKNEGGGHQRAFIEDVLRPYSQKLKRHLSVHSNHVTMHVNTGK